MKLRIQDNSVRFRITIRELELLAREGEVVRETRIPGLADAAVVFRYAVRHSFNLEESCLEASPYGLTLALSETDFQVLLREENEGVYVQREWNEGGSTQRFLAFIEKDRPGSNCVKQEAWIYELNPGGVPVTVPKPPRR